MFTKDDVKAYLKSLTPTELAVLLKSTKPASLARCDQFFLFQGYQLLMFISQMDNSPMPTARQVGHIICALEAASMIEAAMTEQKAKEMLN